MIRIKPVVSLLLGSCLLLPGAARSEVGSMVVIPDTQTYVETNPAIFEGQFDWITRNRGDENIIYVAHLGDLKDDFLCDNRVVGGRTEWQIVNDTLLKLEGSDRIPYGVVPGNHDFNQQNGSRCPNWDTERPLGLYNTVVGPNRFNSQPWYGDLGAGRPGNRVPGSNEDNFTLFGFAGVKFIAINLAYKEDANASGNDPELTWADGLLKAYPDRHGIITSHYFLNQNAEVGGNTATPGPNECARDIPRPVGSNQFSTYGQEVYDRLSNNPNLFLMLSAHKRGEAWRVEDRSAAGQQPVQVLLQDYQSITYPTAPIDYGNLNGTKCNFADSGFMRILRFDTNTGIVNVETFTPAITALSRNADLVSDYFPADGTGMDKDTASNLSFSFAGYARSLPFQRTGSRANDQFVRFLGGAISETVVNDRCADGDGCSVTLTRSYGTTAPVVSGPINFSYDPGNNQFRILDANGNVTRTGTNANTGTEVILGSSADTNCWFSDWDTSGTGSNGDQNNNWSVLILNTTGTNLTCTIDIED